jgi:superfamily II DNA or RNA helicase
VTARPSADRDDGLARVRARLAAAALDLPPGAAAPERVGQVALHPHQRSAVARVRRALATHGGVLLADAVGLGKTWVALAVLRTARAPLVVAPAALHPMWRAAGARADAPFGLISVESLSAPGPPTFPTPDLVVIDEAHHVRTPGTRRHARAAALGATAPLLLLSATPVHNSTSDIIALLSLFLGATAAAALDPGTLAHLVIRRRRRHVGMLPPAGLDAQTGASMPRVARARWYAAPGDPAVLSALVALPPPVPPTDGGHAPALATVTLVRLWASSDAALRAALRRRLARAAALGHALAAGEHPTRAALAAWTADSGAVQLPLLFDAGRDLRPLAAHLAAHEAGVRRALATLDAAPPADPARVATLRAIRARHPEARVVAFTTFADTARATYRALAPGGRVGLLTAAGGRIASGPIGRQALLARFAPRGSGAPDPPAAERVDTLVATDCLSEGLDLRDASVVVHLDLPWTPARLAQRVGRAARMGSAHAEVCVHGLRPGAAAARWLRLARRLRHKAAAARAAMGAPPRPARPDSPATSNLARRFATLRLLEHWLVEGHHPGEDVGNASGAREAPAEAAPEPPAIRCGRRGFVAVWHPGDRGPPTMVAALDNRPPSAAPRRVGRALAALDRGAAHTTWPDPADVAAATRATVEWAARREARRAVGHAPGTVFASFAAPAATRHAREARASADAALRRAPAHERLAVAALLSAGVASPRRAVPLTPGPRLAALVLLVP